MEKWDRDEEEQQNGVGEKMSDEGQKRRNESSQSGLSREQGDPDTGTFPTDNAQ